MRRDLDSSFPIAAGSASASKGGRDVVSRSRLRSTSRCSFAFPYEKGVGRERERERES